MRVVLNEHENKSVDGELYLVALVVYLPAPTVLQ